jgi:hypothetical protein
MADKQQEDKEKKFIRTAKRVGEAVKKVVEIFRRSPSVKDWARRKRQHRRELRSQGLSGSKLRQAVRRWVSQFPKPQGRDATSVMDLGTSNQVDGGNNASIGTFAPIGGAPVRKARFNPLLLLLLVPFVFPKQFKKLTGNIKL